MVIVVMGVTGCGKTTLGKLLADRLGVAFHDADDFHPPANRAKLLANIPLDDDDRAPWLAVLADAIARWDSEGGAVLACSALKQRYRDVLRSSGARVEFIHLVIDREALVARLEKRRARHELVKDFDRIVAGQFRDLEPPADAIELPTLGEKETTLADAIKAMRARGWLDAYSPATNTEMS